MKFRVLLAAGAAFFVVASLGAAASPAQAGEAPGAEVKQVNYLADTCYTRNVNVNGLDPDVESTIQVRGAGGRILADESSSGQSTYSFSIDLCVGSDPVGTYRVVVNDVRAGKFTVAEPVIRLYRYDKRTVLGRLLLRGKVLRHKRVYLQAYDGAEWFDVWDDSSGANGWFGVECKKGETCPFSLRYSYEHFTYSKAFLLYGGSANARLTGAPRSVIKESLTR